MPAKISDQHNESVTSSVVMPRPRQLRYSEDEPNTSSPNNVVSTVRLMWSVSIRKLPYRMRYASSAPPTIISGSAMRLIAPVAIVNLLAVLSGAVVSSDLIGISSMVVPRHPCVFPAEPEGRFDVASQHRALQVFSLCFFD